LHPPRKNSDYFDVDKVAAQSDAAQRVARYFGVSEDDMHLKGKELRTCCFLQCGKKSPTGDRVLAIQVAHAAKIWKCHSYGCDKQGNLVSLVSLAMGHSVRPRGEEFKAVRDKMREIFSGEAPDNPSVPDSPAPTAETQEGEPKPESTPPMNVPLAEHPNERVRGIADLYEKLTLDVSQMPPHASRYVRERKFLTPEVAEKWQIGYLPRDTGGDKAGGTMRGKFVVPIKNRDGQIVAYAGRDTDWERKHQAWIAGNRQGKKPAKWTFPSGFHRGVELFGQERLTAEAVGIKLKAIGLPVVEGPMDVINLAETLNVPSAGILSNNATKHQTQAIARLAHEVAVGLATILLDCDEEGDRGADGLTVELAKLCRVQRAWAMDMHDGQFAGIQPENLTIDTGGKFLRDFLARSVETA